MEGSYKNFKFSADPTNNSLFFVSKDGVEKFIKIAEDPEYCYKILKSKIKSKGGAAGLFEFLDSHIRQDFCTCLVEKVLTNAFYYVNPVKM